MNISKLEQRVLHVLAKGGYIDYIRGDNRKICSIECYTREGFILSDCTLDIFKKLKAKRFIQSKDGQSYLINRNGLQHTRSKLDNR